MNWRLSFVVLFVPFLFPTLILLESMHLFSLFLRRVTAPTPPTIALLLSFRLLLRFPNLCLTPTSSNISNLTIFFHITNKGPRKVRSTRNLLSYLTHTWSSSLKNLGEPFVVALDICKAFDRVCHKALLAQLTALHLPFVNSFLAFYPIALYLLLLTAQPLHPSLSPVVFLRVLSFLLHFFFFS